MAVSLTFVPRLLSKRYSIRMRGRPSWSLFAIWLCFIVRGEFYAVVLPLWEGYDEYSPFAHVQPVSGHRTTRAPAIPRIPREAAAAIGTAPLPWTVKALVPGAGRYDDF